MAKKPSPSRGRRGAVPGRRGCSFRVWAPHADEVYVTGTFNEWSKTAHPLGKDGDGWWSGEVPNAGPGDEFRYRIVAGDGELYRIDPYARRVSSSDGNAIVPQAPKPGRQRQRKIPPLNEMVLYELHIGTFGVRTDEGPSDIEGAIGRLSHLKELGVNVLEIMPIAEFLLYVIGPISVPIPPHVPGESHAQRTRHGWRKRRENALHICLVGFSLVIWAPIPEEPVVHR